MKYSHLDVVEINKVSLVSNDQYPSLASQFCTFFAQLFYYTFVIHFKYRPIPSQYRGIMLFGVSLNNQRSLDPIATHLNSDEYLYLKDHKADVNKRRAMWLSIPYLPTLLQTYKHSDSATKKAIRNNFTRMWSTYGYFQLAKEYIEHYQIKTLVVSNDHGEFHRCLLLNAKSHGAQTIYVQHASIAKGFPRLISSYSFLDGKESLEKYLFDGQPEGDVYLSGGVRFDPIFQNHHLKETEKVKTVGIAINMYDDFDKVKGLCTTLLNHGYKLSLRPHPRYGIVDKAWLEENSIGYSDPKKETSFDFIEKIDLMVSNESSIHLDAAIMRCPTVVFNFSTHAIKDFYSYIKTGLVRAAKNEEHLLDLLKDPKKLTPSSETLRYYNASCGTRLEGKLGIVIADFIMQSNTSVSFDDTYGFAIVGQPYLHVISE